MLKNRIFTILCLCSGALFTSYAWPQGIATSAAVIGGPQVSSTFTDIRSTDAGVSPETIFDSKQKLTSVVNINVDSAHVGKPAAIFIVAMYQNAWFMKNENNLWVAWDLNPENLALNKSVPALASNESVTVEQKISSLVGKLEIYVGYKLENTYTFNANPFVFTLVTGKLNDTGVFYCSTNTQYLDPNQRDSVGNLVPYKCPVAGFAGQDGEYGRDATNNDNSDGQAGFSFTKISSTGEVLPEMLRRGHVSGTMLLGCYGKTKPPLLQVPAMRLANFIVRIIPTVGTIQILLKMAVLPAY